jgi:hypothetical protein
MKLIYAFLTLIVVMSAALFIYADKTRPEGIYTIPEDRSWEINGSLVRRYGVSDQTYVDYTVGKEDVRRDLLRVIAFNGRRWNSDDIETFTQVLMFGHNHKDFKIDYRMVLGLASHESKMKISAINPSNSNGTIDYGLLMHNSCCIDQRFARAIAFNKRYAIVKNRSVTANYYDVGAQSIATILFLSDLRRELDRDGKINGRFFTQRHWILAYNMGKDGLIQQSKPLAFQNRYHHEVLAGYRITEENSWYSSYMRDFRQVF